jgi:hypothetical protein
MPNVRGMPPSGSFRIPKDVFEALGQGDLKLGGLIVHQMFGIEDDPDDATILHPHVLRIIGGSDLATGRKVLERFVARVRRQSRDGVVLHHDGRQHDDGHHGWFCRTMTSPSTDPISDPVFWRAVVEKLGLNPMHSPYSVRSISAEQGVYPEKVYIRFLAHFHRAPWEWRQ